MKPSQARQTNLQILKRAITILKDNFKNEKQGDGTKMKPVSYKPYPKGRGRGAWGTMSYVEWKDLAQERNTYINRVSEFAKYPDKVMHLTGNASVVPPAGKTNHAFKSEASKNGIMIESIAKAKGKGKSSPYGS